MVHILITTNKNTTNCPRLHTWHVTNILLPSAKCSTKVCQKWQINIHSL